MRGKDEEEEKRRRGIRQPSTLHCIRPLALVVQAGQTVPPREARRGESSETRKEGRGKKRRDALIDWTKGSG